MSVVPRPETARLAVSPALYEHALQTLIREGDVDAAVAERLAEPSANPATMSAEPDDTAEGDLERKLRRAWDLISGRYG